MQMVLTLGAVIRLKRTERGWTQQDLAKEVNVSQVTINKIERDRSVPRSQTLEKIEKVLGTNGELREILWEEGRLYAYGMDAPDAER